MSHVEGVRVEELLNNPVKVVKAVWIALDEADSFKQECQDLLKKIERLSVVLGRAQSVGPGNLYGRPTRRIMGEVEKTLERAHNLAKKCKRSRTWKRVITITSGNDFKRVNTLVDNAIEDVTWLLNVSAVGEDRPEVIGLPSIAVNDPVLAQIWEHIAVVQVGTMEDRKDSAATLAIYAKEGERNCKLIIEEGGLPPLLRLLKEGYVPAQETAAEALAQLARDAERVKQILAERAVEVFIQVLTSGSMKVQVKVARALAHMVSHSREAQEEFADAGAIRHLVSLLAYDMLDDSKSQKTQVSSIHTIVKNQLDQKTKTDGGSAINKPDDEEDASGTPRGLKPADETETKASVLVKKPYQVSGLGPAKAASGGSYMKPVGLDMRNASLERSPDPQGRHGHTYRIHRLERDREDPETKQNLKAEAAHALWKLAEGNVKNSKSITGTIALLCFAKLIESGEGDVQRNCVMAVMVIAQVAEKDAELRRAAFKTNSPAATAVVEQLLKVIKFGEPELQAPCIKAIGCLARIFPAPALHVIGPLTSQLWSKDGMVAEEACIALQRFAVKDNFLFMDHSRTILENSGASQLVQLILFDKQAELQALILLSYLALNVADSDAMEKAPSLAALESATRWPNLPDDVRSLLCDAIEHLELYQSGPRAPVEGGKFLV